MLKWELSKLVYHGKFNKERGVECQDNVIYRENGKIQVIGLTDAQGPGNAASESGEAAVRKVAELLAEHFSQLYDMDKKLIQYNVLNTARKAQYEICEKYNIRDLKEVHCTLLIAAIDTEQNKMMIIHLGDGMIGAKYCDSQEAEILSSPKNGCSARYTETTSSYPVMSHIEIKRGSTDEMDEVFLMSDGGNEIEEMDTHMYQTIREKLSVGTLDDIYSDDISMISLKRNSDDFIGKITI